MMTFLLQYSLFAAKVLTLVVALGGLALLIIGRIAALQGQAGGQDRLTIRKLNDKFRGMALTLQRETLGRAAFKKLVKQRRAAQKAGPDATRRHLYVIDFNGDLRASAVASLREEVTAILLVATPQDEVLVRLESGGGMVHAYGLAASQLQRLRDKGIKLTVAVDKIAASGGYMMACVADHLIAAPFAVIGSIGVVAQLPNFHRLLKGKDVDVELLTAGEWKRTLTMFGENTDKGREKFQQELDETHQLFKAFVQQHRPSLDTARVGTGEHWYGSQALDLRLIDAVSTSDDYLIAASDAADLLEIHYVPRQPLAKRLGALGASVADALWHTARQNAHDERPM